ncbi:glycoside hydrolase family 130 protein [Micromonospora halotolerans]|uniref:Glycoside hydrolase family 130 protein n=1 Tax=Micromonospora halotolerans TaxID=709879 RepID=A0ABY9ZRB4_9ACTN|nr:glycoside hydrolase family 130 protein [Micromonospora halotolerans]WNM37803.1 glycoside hydrolase family 130 protein [Micromonospora halotolerans]
MVVSQALAVRQDLTLAPDPRRVIVKLFVPGEDAALVRTRAHALIDRVAHLDDEETGRLLRDTFDRFGGRHRDLDSTFQHHYDLVRHRADPARDLSPTTRLLVGAYFSHEYAVEAAALCNPSMVAHPDQTGLEPGQLRVAVSLRQIGEGHLSSIGFATAVLGPGRRLAVADRSGPPVVGRRVGVRHRRDLLAAGLAEIDCDNEVAATVLDVLPERYDEATFERVLGSLPPDLLSRSTGLSTLEHLRRTNAASYATAFPADSDLHQRVLWPAIPAERNGMEDARFVRFVDESGPVYRATYTAYDGRHIASRALASRDLRRFQITPMRGPGARNKGVALFPRTVGGHHLALCRSDGETIGLTRLDSANRWQVPVPLRTPRHSWELVQVGNCGSPIETDAGWLVLTHGVGPMRRYAIGALLLDLHRPERVIAELPGALLAPDEAERDGYVPNVVYSCGGLVHAGELWLPYGASDARVGFATAPVSALIAAMVEPAPPMGG